MAADTNWKRPWEDETNNTFSASGLPAADFAAPYRNPSASARRAQEDRRLPPISSTFRDALQPSVHVSPVPDRGGSSFRPPSPAPGSPKRRRVQYEQGYGQPRQNDPMLPAAEGIRNIGTLSSMGSQAYADKRDPGGMADPRSQQSRDLQTGRIASAYNQEAGGQYTNQFEPSAPGKSCKPPQSCENCDSLSSIVQEMIGGIVRLHGELYHESLGGPLGRISPQVRIQKPAALRDDAYLLQPPDVIRDGVKESLQWALESILKKIKFAKELKNARPYSSTRSNISQPTLLETSPTFTSIHAQDNVGRWDFERERDYDIKRSGLGVLEEPSRKAEFEPANDVSKRMFSAETPLASYSPHRTASSSGSILARPQSPLQGVPNNRMLLSPSSQPYTATNAYAPASPSAPPSQTAQAAHFQDLQHQVSTKTLALQTLQREHDNLLSAFSRSQTRCSTLEKKFQVSDAEINSLTEERIKLQGLVEGLESQVESLVRSRDEARKQSVANGGQYMKIMGMASKLEAQGAADRKKWKDKEDEWRKERDELKDSVKRLQEACEKHFGASGKMPQNIEFGKDPASLNQRLLPDSSPEHFKAENDVLNSNSVDDLRSEVIRLRRKCHDLDAVLRDFKSEGHRIEQATQALGKVGTRIISKAADAMSITNMEQSSPLVPESSGDLGACDE
ncbi:MAG: hypothetical protein M1819_003142 [Sarea resinae]|nr:MAG: hypothetical protein M1819_003142 [Sarea resinae]